MNTESNTPKTAQQINGQQVGHAECEAESKLLLGWLDKRDDTIRDLRAKLEKAERKIAESLNGARPLPFSREILGRTVRETWVRWAQQQPNPKPHWLVEWNDLTENDKEVDRQIGEEIARLTLVGDAAARCLNS